MQLRISRTCILLFR